jgi:hypothetical protein
MEKKPAQLIFESDAELHMSGKKLVWHNLETFLNIALSSWVLKKDSIMQSHYHGIKFISQYRVFQKVL